MIFCSFSRHRSVFQIPTKLTKLKINTCVKWTDNTYFTCERKALYDNELKRLKFSMYWNFVHSWYYIFQFMFIYEKLIDKIDYMHKIDNSNCIIVTYDCTAFPYISIFIFCAIFCYFFHLQRSSGCHLVRILNKCKQHIKINTNKKVKFLDEYVLMQQSTT